MAERRVSATAEESRRLLVFVLFVILVIVVGCRGVCVGGIRLEINKTLKEGVGGGRRNSRQGN